MQTIWIVMPILILLMFLLGIGLDLEAFKRVAKYPKAVLAGMTGQLVVLPLLAFFIDWAFKLPAPYFIGLVLIACCPGGSSSNVFSMLAKGNVALSVTLTALSSVITLFTIPLIMGFTTNFVALHSDTAIKLPVGKLLVQNLVLLFAPMLAGSLFKHWKPVAAEKVRKVLEKAAFPALMVLAAVFFLQYPREIAENFPVLETGVTALILCSMGAGALLTVAAGGDAATRRTIVIEIGMQNAAQAIAIATSPFIFNDGEIAIPAIIYALMMNVILLIYISRFLLKRTKAAV